MIFDANNSTHADEATNISSAHSQEARTSGKQIKEGEGSRTQVAKPHFISDADILEKSGMKGGKTKVKNRIDTLPQIGSIQDTMQNEPLVDDMVEGIGKTEK